MNKANRHHEEKRTNAWRTIVFVWTITILFLGQFPAEANLKERYRYYQTEGEKGFKYVWEHKAEADHLIRVIADDGTTFNRCDASGETLEWRMDEGDTNVLAKKNDQDILISGVFNGEKVKKILSIGELPWYQSLSYALRQNVKAGVETVTFWMIRPKKLSLLKLKASLDGDENIRLNNTDIPAHKVKLTLAGIKEKLWSGYYWFRKSDGLFVQYKGVNGVPGTPETVIQLLE